MQAHLLPDSLDHAGEGLLQHRLADRLLGLVAVLGRLYVSMFRCFVPSEPGRWQRVGGRESGGWRKGETGRDSTTFQPLKATCNSVRENELHRCPWMLVQYWKK